MTQNGNAGAPDSATNRAGTQKTPGTPSSKSDAHGHRARLRDRFLQDPDVLPDYEVLELILFQANARADVKPLAKRLLAEFGSFARVISATPEALSRVQGLSRSGLAALKAVETGAHRLLKGEIMNRPVLSSWGRILDYCHGRLNHQSVEQLHLLFLDAQNRLIAEELAQTGTVNQSAVYPREIVKRALAHHAVGVIMVHNHPSGDPTPSASDQDVTLKVRDALRAVNIVLHDHVVIGRNGHCSFRSMGLF